MLVCDLKSGGRGGSGLGVSVLVCDLKSGGGVAVV